MQQIKEQNKQILHHINNKQDWGTNSINILDLHMELPLQKEEELNILENVLSDKEKLSALSSYLSSLGGRDTTALTNNILKRCLTNQLACKYSFRGKEAKLLLVPLKVKTPKS
ncbi:hypothetical protein MML48_4g00005282 [Holotrichia oblita]|nr:hypothetical protein MML48_4g00005282 [Holotrichia oblita]